MPDRHLIGRPRPPLFRALGSRAAPAAIEIEGRFYQRVNTFKHDSWAATALYESAGGEKIVCKFNRQQPILGVPMRWLGRLLSRREAAMLDRLADEPLVPRNCGPVFVNSRLARHAVAHDFVPGRPMRRKEAISADFLAELGRLLESIHARKIAYVDLHKRENILVGTDGRPHLIDFQIGVWLPNLWPLNGLLRMLQTCDRYHLAKHVYKQRRDLCTPEQASLIADKPWWIRLHRLVAVPFRRVRRRFLVRRGIRTGTGKAHTEHAPEFGVREWAEPASC